MQEFVSSKVISCAEPRFQWLACRSPRNQGAATLPHGTPHFYTPSFSASEAPKNQCFDSITYERNPFRLRKVLHIQSPERSSFWGNEAPIGEWKSLRVDRKLRYFAFGTGPKRVPPEVWLTGSDEPKLYRTRGDSPLTFRRAGFCRRRRSDSSWPRS